MTLKALPALLAAAAVLAITTATSQAEETVTCSGKIWNLSTSTTGAWLEIGHGIYQCSVQADSEAGKKILSVCNFGKRCTFKVRLAPVPKEADRDDVQVTGRDTVLWVRLGAKNDNGGEYKHEKAPIGSARIIVAISR